MSNLIKAYNIKYREDVKKLDMNQRCDDIRKKYVEEYYSSAVRQKQTDSEEATEAVRDDAGDDFIPGLSGAVVLSEENDGSDDSDLLNDEIAEHEECLANIKKDTAELLEEAREEARRIKEQALADIEIEREAVYREAKQQGYNDGMEAAGRESERVLAELRQQQQDSMEEYEKQVQELEPAFVKIVIEAINKLTGILCDSRTDIISYLIHQGISACEKSNGYIIRVSSQDYEFVMMRKEDIKGFLPERAVLEIVEDRFLSKNQCLIETEGRIFDCSLDMQLTELTEDIRLLSEL